jgi:hypothetical protein
MTEKTVNKAPSGRPSRKPVGFCNRLAVHDQDPNRHYRWINTTADGGDRVEIFKEAGYRIEQKSSQRAATGRVDASPLGSFETTPGGGGDTLVLMSIEKDLYLADQKEKQKRVDDLDRAQKRTPEGLYGKVADEKL